MSDIHGPICAHSRVKRETVRHDDGMCHDEYWCRDCEGGTRFVPAREVADLEVKLAEAEARLAAAVEAARIVVPKCRSYWHDALNRETCSEPAASTVAGVPACAEHVCHPQVDDCTARPNGFGELIAALRAYDAAQAKDSGGASGARGSSVASALEERIVERVCAALEHVAETVPPAHWSAGMMWLADELRRRP